MPDLDALLDRATGEVRFHDGTNTTAFNMSRLDHVTDLPTRENEEDSSEIAS